MIFGAEYCSKFTFTLSEKYCDLKSLSYTVVLCSCGRIIAHLHFRQPLWSLLQSSLFVADTSDKKTGTRTSGLSNCRSRRSAILPSFLRDYFGMALPVKPRRCFQAAALDDPGKRKAIRASLSQPDLRGDLGEHTRVQSASCPLQFVRLSVIPSVSPLCPSRGDGGVITRSWQFGPGPYLRPLSPLCAHPAASAPITLIFFHLDRSSVRRAHIWMFQKERKEKKRNGCIPPTSAHRRTKMYSHPPKPFQALPKWKGQSVMPQATHYCKMNTVAHITPHLYV